MKKTPNFNDYKECLLAGWNALRKQLLFQNRLHEFDTIEVNKLALSRDNKVIQSDGVSTLAHEHHHRHKDVASYNGTLQWFELGG